ncbi:MAG: cytochrome c biogenesis protein CcsA [Deltaproteobacteria bacterium]|nr:cytochrome c biogenesis protein CcsA [Deltaproteobacteria bacterium]
MKSLLLSLIVFSGVSQAATDRSQFSWGAMEKLAIQERGRVKPLQTFAEESVQFVTGSRSFNHLKAIETVFSWLLEYEDQWEKTEFVRVSYGPLKVKLGLPQDKKYFSPQSIRSNEALRAMMREIGAKQQRREKLEDMESKLVNLQAQVGVVDAIVSGQALTIFPSPQGLEANWIGLDGLSDPSRLPYSGPQKEKTEALLKMLFKAFVGGDAATWNANVGQFTDWVRSDLSRGHYPSDAEMGREVHFNELRPFRWAWVIYVVAFIALLVAIQTKNVWATRIGAGILGAGILLHIYGFVLRCWISGRPPVTNMYESVIWVSLGCLVFSIFIWAAYRNIVIPTAASVFSIVALVLADNLPTVLDPGIQPLEPVLRSNFWLTTHVLCITLSYAAFALSLCIGNVVIGNYIFHPKKTAWIQTLSLYMYRAMQIGVILVAGGTILGGVWADYSWGRFWGWDPKEVWALIVLLMYVAVLHGRFAGWLKGFGFVSATIFCFLSVLMAWYGVNFVLGVGLHSYGFGSGGLSYVMMYVAAQVAFVLAGYISHRKSGVASGQIFPGGR